MVAIHLDEGRLLRQLITIRALTWPGAKGICKVGMTSEVFVYMNE